MKKTVAFLFAILFILPSFAQNYPFVRKDRNVLEYPGGKSAEYQLFKRKLDSLLFFGNGNVKVLHIGGSHVQGGTLSDRLRSHFLSLRYGIDGGRGLVFPFSAAQTNTPVSYVSSWNGRWESATCLNPGGEALGVSGIVATAQDTSARAVIDLLPRERRILQPHYAFKSVDVMGEGGMEPVIILHGKDTICGVRGAQITHFDLPYFTDWLQLAFRGSGTFSLRGLYLDRPNAGFTMSEAGINGASTSSWLSCSLFYEDLQRLCPDLVIFSIGINDIQGEDFNAERFKENYRALIKEIRMVNPHCALLFTGINDSWRRRGRGVNEHTEKAEKCFRALAQEYRGVFWDWYEVMGGYGSIEKWQDAGLAQQDKVHFTPLGYRVLGDLLFEAIIADYNSRK